MRVNTNISSLVAQENSINVNNSISSSLEKLSSGLKINKASDDASGLAIADKLRTQATSIQQGADNASSAITLLQIADKSMAEQSNILDIVKAKLIQANTDTTSSEGRASILKDITKLLEQFDNIATQTNYNGRQLIASQDGSTIATGHNFQIGEKATDMIATTDIHSSTVGLSGGAGSGVINETLNSTNTTLSGIVASDSNFNLNFVSNGNLTVAGQGGVITFSNNIAIVANVPSTLNTYLNSITNPNFIAVGGVPGNYLGYAGSSIDLTGQSYSSLSIIPQNTNDTFSFNSVDLTSITYILGGNDVVITGSKTTTGGGVGLSNLKALGLLSNADSASYQTVVDDAISKVNEYRGEIGSTQNQVESAMRNLLTQVTNVKAAESIIRDVDYAKESSNFNKQNIISQAGSYAISQANTLSQNVLRFLN